MRIGREYVEPLLARVIAEQTPTVEEPLPEPLADWCQDDCECDGDCDCCECEQERREEGAWVREQAAAALREPTVPWQRVRAKLLDGLQEGDD